MNRRKKRVSQTITRPTRTAVQGTPAWALTFLLDQFVNLTDKQFGAVVVVVTLVIGWVQVAIENHVGKGFLRDVPPTTDPVPVPSE